MKILRSNGRIWLAVALFSFSVVCFVYAAPPKLTVGEVMKQCNHEAVDFLNQCIFRNTPVGADQGTKDAVKDSCLDSAKALFRKCCHDYGYIPKNGPFGPVQQISPPPKSNPQKPRKGPGNISGLPESNPTPTPRKGPGKTGTSGISHSSPTPTPSGPVLLEKNNDKPSPTPHSTPKKNHH